MSNIAVLTVGKKCLGKPYFFAMRWRKRCPCAPIRLIPKGIFSRAAKPLPPLSQEDPNPAQNSDIHEKNLQMPGAWVMEAGHFPDI